MPSRRTVLRSAGVGFLASVAGCAAGDQPNPTDTTTAQPGSWGHVRPAESPPVVPGALECAESDLQRPDPNADVSWGDADWNGTANALGLRVENTEYALGDTVEIRLYNLSETDQGTRTREEFLVQLRTEAGWQTVFGYAEDGPYPFTDDAVIHEPGRSLIWNISLTADGVLGQYAHPERASVCPDLQPGRYRFVFPIGQPALAVAFDVTA
jgi:hypothetical protein